MAFAPIFGYLGDRYTRKYVMAVGILIWTITTLAGSFTERNVSINLCILWFIFKIYRTSFSPIWNIAVKQVYILDKVQTSSICNISYDSFIIPGMLTFLQNIQSPDAETFKASNHGHPKIVPICSANSKESTDFRSHIEVVCLLNSSCHRTPLSYAPFKVANIVDI